MSEATLDASIGLLTAAGVGSLFLPAIENVWSADPATREGHAVSRKVNAGGQLFGAFLGSLAVLYALRARSFVPIIVGAAVAGVVLWNYNRALQATDTADA